MKNTVFITFSILVLFLVFSCNKEKCGCNDSEIIGKWQVEEFMSIESVAYFKDNDYNPAIEFKTDDTYNLILDVNSCGGTYNIKDGSELECSAVSCTEICCDSPFSQKFAEMLPMVTTFEIEEDTLRLDVPVWGWINLERVSD